MDSSSFCCAANTLGLHHAGHGDWGLVIAMAVSFVPTEYITIIGLGIGAMVIMAPAQVLEKSYQDSFATLKGIPYSKKSLCRLVHGHV